MDDFNYYDQELHMSIMALYDTGNKNIYYRDLKIEDLPKWLQAHQYTHPGVESYTIRITTY